MDSSAPQLLDLAKLTAEVAMARLIEHAATMGASDLFIVTNEQHVAALVRHLGIVRTISVLGSEQGKRCIAHLRNSAGMEPAEKRRCSDGRWIFQAKELDEQIDLRINAIPTLHGEDLAIRLLSRSTSIYPLEKLGMTAEQLTAYKTMLANPSGLILITGPTGSGKTANSIARCSRSTMGGGRSTRSKIQLNSPSMGFANRR